ncbi:hypothetical protein [Mucilaginibacter terrae]|uniref:VCBS repeat-containing protein n=1 Tax=Mucilaginibacter terrae TaxID=1955052 RepID=A0ABU3GVW0_9SPHI|nr:hypothetical protein [Mucilaginibacter terrae]MDT3403908.1 hypothetical protein [Mucilaginibacter terrae]
MRRLFLIPLSLFTACGNKQSYKFTGSDSMKSGRPVQAKVVLNTPVVDTVLQFFPDDSTYAAQILYTGTFHNNEVKPQYGLHTWMGIFHNNKVYCLKETRLKLARVADDELDERDAKTGWQISTVDKDSSVLLISNLPSLKNHPIEKIELNKNEFLPGDSATYSQNGIKYTIYATGQKKPDYPGSKSYSLFNYRLALKATVKGIEYNELLFATNTSEFGCSIILASDIDNDGIPDLVINTSTESAIYTISLYMSSLAKKGHLLKIAGMNTTVGC